MTYSDLWTILFLGNTVSMMLTVLALTLYANSLTVSSFSWNNAAVKQKNNKNHEEAGGEFR